MSQYKHLLLAIDIYENCDALFSEALRLQKLYQAKLSVVHVIPHIVSSMPYAYDFQESIREHADKRIAEIKAQYNFSNDVVHLEQGNPKKEVTNLAARLGVDLILCGSHGKHGLELILGSTANGILHLAACDVLTLRVNTDGQHMVNTPYKSIVLATDLQNDNLGVVQAAKDWAAQCQATLYVVNVVGDVASLGYYPAIEVDLKGDAVKKLDELIDQAQLSVAKDHRVVRIGFPQQEILDVAQTANAELIIIGSHGRKGLSAALLGSTANSVLHGSKSDVLVVRV